jgi:hypothetical protein
MRRKNHGTLAEKSMRRNDSWHFLDSPGGREPSKGGGVREVANSYRVQNHIHHSINLKFHFIVK